MSGAHRSSVVERQVRWRSQVRFLPMHDADGSRYLYRVQFAAQNERENVGRFTRMLSAMMRSPKWSKSGKDDQVASSAVSSTAESEGRPDLPKRKPGTTYFNLWKEGDSSKTSDEPAIDAATGSVGADQFNDAESEQYISYADAQRLSAESTGDVLCEANPWEASAEPGDPDGGEVHENGDGVRA